MTHDLTPLVPCVLSTLGTWLQWLRQYRSISEGVPGVIAFLEASGAYLVLHRFGHDWRWEVVSALLTVAGYTASVLGGTYAMARASSVTGFVPAANSR